MDLLDRLLGHDAWTTRLMLEIATTLKDEQMDRDFDIGHRTVRATLDHMIWNIEIWSMLMESQSVPERDQNCSQSRLIERHDVAAERLAGVARQVAEQAAWDETWVDPLDGTSRSFGGSIAHVITHSMHHRAQLLYLFRMLGVEELPEGDVLSWESSQI